ncbi:MAG TPA: hypothetical protein PLT03_06005 [Bacillota bacterium]|nr:hypothetical protein [Bacillota bacterium]HOA16169.1 hypothetical protein [Bacillota bacterium]HOG53408.1 hypothetical protein [Bacillota bacterium]
MSMLKKAAFAATVFALLLSLGLASASADPAQTVPAGPAAGLPPTQGTGPSAESSVYGMRILASSNGTAMVTFLVEADLSAGVSLVDAGLADDGMLEGSLLIRSMDKTATLESVLLSKGADGRQHLRLQALSSEGGKAVFEVTYMTKSISWSVSGYMVAGSDMKADMQLFLSVRNSSAVDYKGAELQLYGTKGRIAAGNSTSIAGEQLWSIIKPAGQALDLAAEGELRMSILELKDIAFTTYAGSTLGTGLKGYSGRQVNKEPLKVEIYLETAANDALAGLPSESVSMAVYLEGNENGMIPAAALPPSNVHIANKAVLLRLDLPSEITAEAERLDSKLVGTSSYEESYRIRVRSTSKYSTEVRLLETFPGEWELISYIGGEWRKIGPYATIKLTVPANGTVDTMYKVRYTYVK